MRGLQPIQDPLEQIVNGAVHEFLEFFAEHPGFVELLIQERALFKDRKRPTFIEHRMMNIDRWRAFYRDLIEQKRVRDIPVDRHYRRDWKFALWNNFYELF